MRNTTSSRLGEAGCSSGGGDGGGGGAIQTSVLAFFPYRWVRSARASALGYELCKAPVFCFSSSALSLSRSPAEEPPPPPLARSTSQLGKHVRPLLQEFAPPHRHVLLELYRQSSVYWQSVASWATRSSKAQAVVKHTQQSTHHLAS
jgi:hypothetical protein